MMLPEPLRLEKTAGQLYLLVENSRKPAADSLTTRHRDWEQSPRTRELICVYRRSILL